MKTQGVTKMKTQELDNKYVDLITNELKRLLKEDPMKYLEINNGFYESDYERIFFMEEFNDILGDEEPIGLAKLVQGGTFNCEDAFFTFDEFNGFLVSSNYPKDLVFNDQVVFLAKNILSGDAYYDNDNIDILLKKYTNTIIKQSKYEIK